MHQIVLSCVGKKREEKEGNSTEKRTDVSREGQEKFIDKAT